MDVLATVIAAVETLIKLEPVIVQAGTNLKPYAVALYQKLSGQDITDEQRTALETALDALYADFEQPLPPETPAV